jgi:UDP-N-acetylmuramate dehydrogenase
MKIEENISLRNLTTFRIGGRARYFCEANSVDDINKAVLFAEKNSLPVFILGGGSNILISDSGFPGLTIKINLRGISIEDKNDEIIIVAGAGESWDGFVGHLIENKIFGLELLSGIPGTVGASPVQNIGAYGDEVAQFIEWVNVFDTRTKKIRKLSNSECGFSYRDSIFKKEEGKFLIITEVTFRVPKKELFNQRHSEILAELSATGTPMNGVRAEDIRRAVLSVRERKLPDLSVYGTAGSFFKNPEVDKKLVDFLVEKYPDMPVFEVKNSGLKKLSAGWLIENAGNAKGMKRGGVGIYEKHALVIVNYGDGKANEIFSLTTAIQKNVLDVFGVKLQFEVCFIGDF